MRLTRVLVLRVQIELPFVKKALSSLVCLVQRFQNGPVHEFYRLKATKPNERSSC